MRREIDVAHLAEGMDPGVRPSSHHDAGLRDPQHLRDGRGQFALHGTQSWLPRPAEERCAVIGEVQADAQRVHDTEL